MRAVSIILFVFRDRIAELEPIEDDLAVAARIVVIVMVAAGFYRHFSP